MSGFPSPTGPATRGPAPDHADHAGPSYGRALLATLVWAALNVVAMFALLGPTSAEVAGAAIGGMLVPSLLAALITWRVARRVATRSFWQLALLALPSYLLLRLFFVALRAVGAGAD